MLLLYVMLKLRCGAVWDGKHMQPFLKFLFKAEIHFSIKVFLGATVLTALGPNHVMKPIVQNINAHIRWKEENVLHMASGFYLY